MYSIYKPHQLNVSLSGGYLFRLKTDRRVCSCISKKQSVGLEISINQVLVSLVDLNALVVIVLNCDERLAILAESDDRGSNCVT